MGDEGSGFSGTEMSGGKCPLRTMYTATNVIRYHSLIPALESNHLDTPTPGLQGAHWYHGSPKQWIDVGLAGDSGLRAQTRDPVCVFPKTSHRM